MGKNKKLLMFLALNSLATSFAGVTTGKLETKYDKLYNHINSFVNHKVKYLYLIFQNNKMFIYIICKIQISEFKFFIYISVIIL